MYSTLRLSQRINSFAKLQRYNRNFHKNSPLCMAALDNQNKNKQNPLLHQDKNNLQRCWNKRNRSTALVVYDSLKDLKSSPVPALVLGFSGLIPFVAAPGFLIMSQVYSSQIAFAQMAYGASILSFLGGVRWGFAVLEETALRPDWYNMGMSVMPSLIAWVGLLLPDPYSIFTVMCGLAGAGYYDVITWGYPLWFKGLRFCLTFVAVLSLWTTFVCKLMLKDSNESSSKEKDADTK